MAKFLRVGVHSSNLGGYTSKAWTIRCAGSTVLLNWGSVEVHGVGRSRRIYWAVQPRKKMLRFETKMLAQGYEKRAIARRRHHRYERLPETVSIERLRARRHVEPERLLTTVLFVDIVGSTEKVARLGDRRWNGVLGHYYAALRKELRANRGREITTTGDGMLAIFDRQTGAARAVRCATAMRQAVHTLGLEIRAGVHAGDCELIGDGVGGIVLHIGARVMAKAGANEVLVSSAVKALVTEAEIAFEDRGVHRLKGVSERCRLYRVL